MARDDDDPGAQLLELQWKQGSLIHRDGLDELDIRADAFVGIVASQDCDIAAHTAVEPTVELMLASHVPRCETRNIDGRNPRLFDLEFDGDSIRLAIRDRCNVEKLKLVELGAPMSRLPKPGSVSRWLGRRYTRVAWPDQFEKEIGSGRASKKLKRLLSRDDWELVPELYFSLTPFGKLETGQKYELSVICAVAKDCSPTGMRVAHGLAADLREVLSDCALIQVNEVDAERASNITLGQLRDYKLYSRYEYLSEADGSATSPA